MASFLKFRNQIFKYSIIVAIIMELVSVIFIGLSTKFLLGMVVGTAVTLLNFSILERSSEMLMKKNSTGPMVGGYFIRMPIYGVAFYLCLRAGLYCAVACGLGFVTLPVALLYIYGIKSRFPGAEKNPLNDWKEPKEWNDLSDAEDEDDWGPLPKWTEDKNKQRIKR